MKMGANVLGAVATLLLTVAPAGRPAERGDQPPGPITQGTAAETPMSVAARARLLEATKRLERAAEAQPGEPLSTTPIVGSGLRRLMEREDASHDDLERPESP